MCEDVDGIELQAESEDDNKDEYKVFTEYTLMLRSMLYPKQTIEFKQVWSITNFIMQLSRVSFVMILLQ